MNAPLSAIPWLTMVTFLPVAGAVGALLTRRNSRMARPMALIAGLAELALAVFIWLRVPGNGGMGLVERADWAPSLGLEYKLGVDGLGALMVLLSALVTLMAVLASSSLTRKATGTSSGKSLQQPGLYYGLILLLEAGLMGTFTALNFFHWFLYWELSLIPAFFLIKLWGGARRGPAATQFFVYTMVGSVALLLAFLGLYLSTGSADFEALARLAASGGLEALIRAHLGSVSLLLACGVLLGFAVKVPLMPFHTWLPSAYSEAPSPVTMLLTGAMSKMGVYGLLRIALPIFGAQLAAMRTPLLALAVGTAVLGAWAAVAQRDLKRVFAYSSVNHLGYCLVAIFAVAVPGAGGYGPVGLSQAAALDGVVLQMFNHGMTAAALLWFVAILEQRSGGQRQLDSFGGLRKPAPVLAGLMGIALFSSLGLPGLNGFVGEFLIFRGVFPLAWVAATVSVLGLLVGAAVILTVIQRVFSGPVAEKWAGFEDLTAMERVSLAPAPALMLVLGLAPELVLHSVNQTVKLLLAGGRF